MDSGYKFLHAFQEILTKVIYFYKVNNLQKNNKLKKKDQKQLPKQKNILQSKSFNHTLSKLNLKPTDGIEPTHPDDRGSGTLPY